MIADMLNKILNPIITELFIRGRKLNISLAFITQSHFAVPKDIRLNSMHYFIMKIPNKKELQQIASHHSLDIDFKDFMNLYRKCIAKPYSFLVIDATIALDNPLQLRKNLVERILKLITTIDDKIIKAYGKIDKYEYFTGEEILPPDERRVIEQTKFSYSPVGKAFEIKQKQLKIKEENENGKQLLESNELVKKDFNIDRDSILLEEQQKKLINLLKKGLMNFAI